MDLSLVGLYPVFGPGKESSFMVLRPFRPCRLPPPRNEPIVLSERDTNRKLPNLWEHLIQTLPTPDHERKYFTRKLVNGTPFSHISSIPRPLTKETLIHICKPGSSNFWWVGSLDSETKDSESGCWRGLRSEPQPVPSQCLVSSFPK